MYETPFPEIDDRLATAPAPQPAAVEQTNAITASISVVQGEVAKFDRIEAGLAAIEKAHPKNVIVAAIDTPAGMKTAEASWRAYRNPRLEVERARKAAKAPVLALGKAIDTFAGTLETRLVEGETHYKGQIDREEERRAAIKAEADRIAAEKAAETARIESARIKEHQDNLGLLRSYLQRAQHPDMTAERIAVGIEHLASQSTGPEWEEFTGPALAAQIETLQGMHTLHAQAVAREAEAARLELQRAENARVAAELAAERKRLADEAAAVKAQALELQRKLDAQAKKEAAELAASERLESRARKEAEAVQAAKDMAAAIADAARERLSRMVETPTPVLSDKAESDAKALAWVDGLVPATAPQVATPEGDKGPPMFLDLDDIEAMLGFTMYPSFITDTLGITPAATDDGAPLFNPSQWGDICDALLAHITDLKETQCP